MDVVKAVMDRLKGTISVRSVPGEGTTFRLKVPLTLAIIKALLFRVSERLYAVPLGNVLEILRSRESEVHVVDGQEVLQIREEVVPLIRLSRMHAARRSAGSSCSSSSSALGDRKVGLVVDRLIGEQELVIKALDETLISTRTGQRRQHPGRWPRRADPQHLRRGGEAGPRIHPRAASKPKSWGRASDADQPDDSRPGRG